MSYAEMPQMDEPLSAEERDKLIDEVARKIVGRRMESPAILFLEMHKPVTFIASQGMVAMSPFLAQIFGRDGVRKYAQLLSSADNLELLIRRIEDLSEERDASGPKSSETQDG
jgi:hypothetical protein